MLKNVVVSMDISCKIQHNNFLDKCHAADPTILRFVKYATANLLVVNNFFVILRNQVLPSTDKIVGNNKSAAAYFAN